MPIAQPALLHATTHTHARHSTRREPRSPAERRHVEETVAAIRLRTRHHDPFEEWEKQTRKDALVRVSR